MLALGCVYGPFSLLRLVLEALLSSMGPHQTHRPLQALPAHLLPQDLKWKRTSPGTKTLELRSS